MGEGDRSPDAASEEGFDSFGPVGDFRRSQQRPPRPPAPQSPHDFTRILVAEDDNFHRRVLRVLLASPRISMIEVEDGQAAVDLLALRSFDLVLLDLTLPKMTGEDVVRWIRQSHTPWADIPILGMVEEDMESRVGRLTSMGMTDWIAKPLDRQQLTEKIVLLMPALYDAGL
jgi:two-component system CAI-1 autoinducer sensor kinase/phosphatase CqsS